MIRLHKLSLGYGGRMLLQGADVGFGRGEFSALIGRNGTGKSTLLRAIAALQRPTEGHITLGGKPLSQMNARRIASLISFVSTDEVRVPNLRVADVVALGRAPYTDWAGRLGEEDRLIVLRSLKLVGMESFAAKHIDRLSDGERQRAMIARALAQDTPVILLDEPTAFLDLPNKYEIGLLLRELAHREGKCILFSTHDLGVALELCDTIAMIHDCRLIHAAAQDLIDQGLLGRLFEDTPLWFDTATRQVRLKKQSCEPQNICKY
ncbi:ABC transporter ATP-binding protein [Bacteroidia bacterium]|nr:ABC transporter ATP-binding protein [Bacteroidia bacterium]